MLTLRPLSRLLWVISLLTFIQSVAGNASAQLVVASNATAVSFSSVCPDLRLYPKGNKADPHRPMLSELWAQGYPIFIYNATDHKRYWLEPPTKKLPKHAASGSHASDPSDPDLIEINRVFTPATFTIEKVIIAVCGLHFSQTATSTQNNTPHPRNQHTIGDH